MNRATRSVLLTGAVFALVAGPLHAIITFTQLDSNTFTVSHRVKIIGSRGKATKMVYTKASSLCVAAGYAYYQVLDQESSAAQQYEAANATLTLRFFLEDGKDRIACQASADPDYVQEAREKLQKMGYQPPAPEPPGSDAGAPEAKAAAGGSRPCPEGCTLEQIAAMARAGFSDERIRVACGAAPDQGSKPPEN